jgi:hypothetical protein
MTFKKTKFFIDDKEVQTKAINFAGDEVNGLDVVIALSISEATKAQQQGQPLPERTPLIGYAVADREEYYEDEEEYE